MFLQRNSQRKIMSIQKMTFRHWKKKSNKTKERPSFATACRKPNALLFCYIIFYIPVADCIPSSSHEFHKERKSLKNLEFPDVLNHIMMNLSDCHPLSLILVFFPFSDCVSLNTYHISSHLLRSIVGNSKWVKDQTAHSAVLFFYTIY